MIHIHTCYKYLCLDTCWNVIYVGAKKQNPYELTNSDVMVESTIAIWKCQGNTDKILGLTHKYGLFD